MRFITKNLLRIVSELIRIVCGPDAVAIRS